MTITIFVSFVIARLMNGLRSKRKGPVDLFERRNRRVDAAIHSSLGSFYGLLRHYIPRNDDYDFRFFRHCEETRRVDVAIHRVFPMQEWIAASLSPSLALRVYGIQNSPLESFVQLR